MVDLSQLPWREMLRKESGLPWASWYERRCNAVKETNRTAYSGRCELKKGHPESIDHALERGMDTPRWSTKWTS